MFAKSHRSELRAGAKCSISCRADVFVTNEAVRGDGDFQALETRDAVKEFPVFIGLDRFVPAQISDRLGACQECVAGHIAPSRKAVTLRLTSMHPDPLSVHQRRQHRRTTTAHADIVLIKVDDGATFARCFPK